MGARACSYQLTVSVLRLLESQEQQARLDIARLVEMRARALADPAEYLGRLLANVRRTL